MKMEELYSGDSVGVGTIGTGGIILKVWDKYGGRARALLTTREGEFLIEQLQDFLELAIGERALRSGQMKGER